ncbi:unnamed protein product [Moneuplotes crassus]|uniref:EamA domain-containing protein n=1 Tax=Euplotes crassus TaxID=5936 RepID=A0AAD1UNX2_EUPCR|nr:unnamed protein product [Moneuplotes crassus]
MNAEIEDAEDRLINKQAKNNLANGPTTPYIANLNSDENSEEEIPLEISDYYNSWEVRIADDTIQNANLSISRSDAIKGFVLMIFAVIWTSIMHISVKAAFARNPNLTNFDALSFIGYSITSFYFLAARVSGVTLNLFNFERRIGILVIVRTLASNLMNIFLFAGMKYISVGKSTLIFNLNPLFCMIIAFFALSEKITPLNIAAACGSLGGIYLLTINDSSDDGSGGTAILGYICVFSSAWIYGFIFVCVRLLNIRGIHQYVPPFYIGVMALGTTILVLIFCPSYIYLKYDFWDTFFLGLNGIGAICVQLFLTVAYKYGLASRLAICQYLENVFTLLADILIFSYAFTLTDILGIIVIVICISIPIVVHSK